MAPARRLIVVAVALTALAACAPARYPRAVVDVPDVERAIALSKELDARKGQPAPDGVAWFDLKRGSRPVIVTAPHSTEPFRQGQFRFSDGGGTAALAVALHEICGVTALYTTYRSPSDPNFYDDNDFKRRLGALIGELAPVLVLDVHASHPYRPYEVDIGTMDGRSPLHDTGLVRALIDGFTKGGVAGVSVDWFAASKNATVTRYASSRGVPAVQLEFSATRVTPQSDALSAHRFAQTTQAVAAFLASRGLCARAER